MVSCGSTHCSRRFCEHCLNVHLAHSIASDPQGVPPSDPGWKCPVCRKSCCCSLTVCTQQHRHCKAYRYRRRRAEQIKKASPGPAQAAVEPAAAGPSPRATPPQASPSQSDVTADPSPLHGPDKNARGAEKGSIAALLDGDSDARVWLTPTFWHLRKGPGRDGRDGAGGGEGGKAVTPDASCQSSLVGEDRLHSSGSGTASPQPPGVSLSPQAEGRPGGGRNAVAMLLCAVDAAPPAIARCPPAPLASMVAPAAGM